MTVTINGAGPATLNANGYLGVGTNSPQYQLDILTGAGGVYAAQFQNGTAAQGMRIVTGMDSTSSGITTAGGTRLVQFDATNNNTLFYTNATERMRIDSSGNLLVGTTNADVIGANVTAASVRPGTDGCLSANGNNKIAAAFGRGTADGYLVYFYGPSAVNRGGIAVSGSTIQYNSFSDYRLKEEIKPMTGALEKVALLNPVTYKWKDNGTDGQGFIAHELQAVVPDAVTGEKDAVDAEGNPVYQGIDTSFLVATLAKAIQELSAKNDALESRITALEAK